MSDTYYGVISRLLNREERRVPTEEEQTPLVLEPLRSANKAFLEEFLQHHSTQIKMDLARHGAVLLRGFGVESASDFERVTLSIRGMSGIDELLLSEPGRSVVPGSRYVFYTNTLVKTGGTLNLATFHTENYYIPEVPQYVAFFCELPGKLGGETGLLNDVKLYAGLPDDLKVKLEERACLTAFFPLDDMVTRYGVSADLIGKFCKDLDLSVIEFEGERHISIFKPSVIEHPLTHERALQIHFGALPPELNKPMARAFLPDYTGTRWLLHRLSWKYPWFGSGSTHHVQQLCRLAAKKGQGSCPRMPDAHTPEARTVKSLFTQEEVEILASCIRRSYSSFPWRRGDILIVDNLKTAHSGMAGLGKRELKVMMCNPLILSAPDTSPGLLAISNTLESPGLGHALDHVQQRGSYLTGRVPERMFHSSSMHVRCKDDHNIAL